MKKVSISIIIPAYNESKRIVRTLNKIVDYFDLGKWDYEILVVDDGSKDNTIGVINELSKKNKRIKLLQNKKNKGKGYSVRAGILNARNELVLFTDADLSTPIEELDKFMRFIDVYDIIIGSRRLKGSRIKIKQPFYRRIPGKIFPILVNLLVLKDIQDSQCGFKLFKRKAAIDIFKRQTIKGFGFDVEVLYLAKRLGYRIKEIPVVWINDVNSRLDPIKDSYRMFKELLKIKFNSLSGKYSLK